MAAELELGLQRKLSTFREGAVYEGLPAQEGGTIPAQWGSQPPLNLGAAPTASTAEPTAVAAAAAAPGPAGGAGTCSSSEEQVGTLLRLAAWLALLFAGYGFQRGLCSGGLPYDCGPANAADVFQALTTMAFTGGALAWLAGVTRPERFAWLAASRRCYLWLAYAATLPAYSALSNIPALHASLASTGTWHPAMFVVLSLAGVAALAALAFHIWLAAHADGPSSGIEAEASAAVLAEVLADAGAAGGGHAQACPLGSNLKLAGGISSKARGGRQQRRQRRRACLRALGFYLLPRLAVLAYFGAWLIALPASGAFELHLHHYALGWALACFAAFNHPVSGLALALGAAIYVQGGAAYGFDPLFLPSKSGGCLPVSSPPSGQMTCSFWASAAFDLRFCSDTPWIPWFDCNVAWPWPETAIAAAAATASSGGGSSRGGGSSGGGGGRATAAALGGKGPASAPAGAAAPSAAAETPAAAALLAAAAQAPAPTLLSPEGEPLGSSFG